MPMVKGIRCDRCGKAMLYKWEKDSRHEVEKNFRKAGWSIGKRVLCPECKQELQKSK